jgi:hypothetical protein
MQLIDIRFAVIIQHNEIRFQADHPEAGIIGCAVSAFVAAPRPEKTDLRMDQSSSGFV